MINTDDTLGMAETLLAMPPSAWLLLCCLFLSGTLASPLLDPVSQTLSKRHGDEHAHVNETQLPQDSDTSYFLYDYYPNPELDFPQDSPRHGGLILFHGLVMVANYMMLLPAIIVLRSRRHRLTWILQTAFWALNLLGWSTGRAYRRGTPDLYPGSTHGNTGGILLLLSAFITATDIIPNVMATFSSKSSVRLCGFTQWAHKICSLVTGNKQTSLPIDESEYLPIVESAGRQNSDIASTPTTADREEVPVDEVDMLNATDKFHMQSTPPKVTSTVPWSKSGPYFTSNSRHLIRRSLGSDHSTLHDESPTPSTPDPHITFSQRISRVYQLVIMVLERSLVPYAWGQALSGVCIYFGLGRTHYITGVVAHFIKGSIFWWYAILTFSRYLGAWRHWGWAWNSVPHSSASIPWSAAFVESLVIFLYGFTQQFMERLGKQPGDPYSAKDVEHISIAVMFWAGGLVGMAIESPSIRKWLIGEANTRHTRNRRKQSINSIEPDKQEHGVGSRASNPLPAVVVGITGLAMSAHHQTYQFQVQIHALWGYLLLGFAICRCITCFLEWVRRPEGRMSTLPGMPPTELVGSVFLGAGGIAFICSDEEITLWAMRTHRDDVMMFLNLSIAFTCVAYVWVTAILLLSGKTRKSSRRL